MSVGTIVRTITKTLTKHPVPVPIPRFNPFSFPGSRTEQPEDIHDFFGPGLEIPVGFPGGNPGGRGPPHGDLPDPDRGGHGDPEPDWDKIFDPPADPTLDDPKEKWAILFQNWCVHTAKLLMKFAKEAPTGTAIKTQAPWFAYVITTIPRGPLLLTQLQGYLEQWYGDCKVVISRLAPPEAFVADDKKQFDDLSTLLSKLIEQLKKLEGFKWTGFMTSTVGSNPQVGGGNGGANGGGSQKPGNSSGSGGNNDSHNNSGHSDDEDHNPGDRPRDRPDQEQAAQHAWEILFRDWRASLILQLGTIRQAGQSDMITLLITQLRTGPAVGSNQAQINAQLTMWRLAARDIQNATHFDLFTSANLDVALNRILDQDLEYLRLRLADLVAQHAPNYQWMGHPV